ncbi:methylosome subunit pICln isoform X1 [Cotesia glomerata]|uniref:methylosome subunit pICln isoform X1 n=1 Tax=Cotesia glomerata TaxID=32391 RepID=UPI001D00DCA2|nr:methylosome subunit pICln isoform X1 [Cotesia glomerata]
MVVLSNFLAPQEGIRHEEPNTTLYLDDREVGKGTLYITESVLSWVNSTTQQGFSLEYPHISIHAISRNEVNHPRHHLYVVVDAKVDLPGFEEVQQNEENSDEDDNSEHVNTHMRFAPDNTQSLDAMYQAMSQCQILHPDPNDSHSDDEEDDEDKFEDAEPHHGAKEDDGEEEEEYRDAYEIGAGDAPHILPPESVANNQNGNGNGNNFEDMDVDDGRFDDVPDQHN